MVHIILRRRRLFQLKRTFILSKPIRLVALLLVCQPPSYLSVITLTSPKLHTVAIHHHDDSLNWKYRREISNDPWAPSCLSGSIKEIHFIQSFIHSFIQNFAMPVFVRSDFFWLSFLSVFYLMLIFLSSLGFFLLFFILHDSDIIPIILCYLLFFFILLINHSFFLSFSLSFFTSIFLSSCL